MILLRLAARNATRNFQRTLLTAGTVVFGTALLTVGLAWINGIFGQMFSLAAASTGDVRLVDPDFAAREDLFPMYEYIPDVGPLSEKVREVPGVIDVYPRIITGVTLTVGDEIGDVFGLAVGAPKEWYEKRLELGKLLVDGRLLEEKDDLVLGKTLSDRLNAKVGSEVVLLGQTQDGSMSPVKGTVVGIVSGGNALIDQQVFMNLEPIQYMVDIEGGATELLVYGDDPSSAVPLAERVRSVGGSLLVQAWSQRDPWSGMMNLINVVRGTLSGIIVFITALGVWNTMMMSVLERTGEIGVMRAMGLSSRGAVFLFVIEALTIAALGGMVGVLLGSVGAGFLETYGVELGDQVTQNTPLPIRSRMFADLSWSVVGTSFGLGLGMAVVGSFPPSFRAALIQPVTAMRSRR